MTSNQKLVRTLLSKKPAKSAALVSIMSLLILVIVFAIYQEDSFGLSRYLTANFTQVFTRHEFWRMITSPLVHADIEHLGSNALFFVGLAYLLNGYFGLWAFPILSFLSGGLINLIVLHVYPPDITVVGASGIVYFMASFWLTLYSTIERGVSKTRRLTNAIALALVLFFPEMFRERVSYLSHAIGFGLGIVLGILFFMTNRKSIQSHEVWKEEVEEDFPVHDSGCQLSDIA